MAIDLPLLTKTDAPLAKSSVAFASGLNPYTGTFGTAELVHLFKRTLFGVKQADIVAFSGKTLNTVINTLLTASATPPAPPVNNYNSATYTDPNVAAGQTWVNAVYTDGTANSGRTTSFKAWWTGLMLNQQRTIEEKLVLFWHNHFANQVAIVADARYSYKQNALFRSLALGNFKDLVKQVTLDPSMLKYLNGITNVKTAANENYARELQELFTIGKGPNSKYTETDVQTAAKVLTGYNINATTVTYTFDATKHDVTNKQFSAFYANKLITGKAAAAGATELDDLLNMIFATNECAMFICRKLYRFFVYYAIDDTIEANIITPLAAIFRNNNYDIVPVLKALLSSEHFFDVQSRGCVIKCPVDMVVGVCREFELVFPPDTDYVNAYYMWDYIRTIASNLQQNLGDPPNVAGWPAYYQEPQFHELWINSDTLPKRNQFTDLMLASGYTRNGKKIIIDVLAFTDKLPNPLDPTALVNDVLTQLYVVPTSQAARDFLKSILLSAQLSDHYWTDAWTAYKANPTNATTKGIVSTRLLSFYKYILDLPEYQLL